MPIFEIDTTLEIIDKLQNGTAVYTKRPKIPIKLHYSKSHRYSSFPIDCLLDSGADKNLFPSHVGKAVGIQIEKGQPVWHFGIGGVRLKAFRHIVDIILKNYQFTTEIDFSDNQNLPLLGREGFFVFFKEIGFIKNDKIILQTPK